MLWAVYVKDEGRNHLYQYFHGNVEVLYPEMPERVERVLRNIKHTRYHATFFTDEQKSRIGELPEPLTWECVTMRYANALNTYLIARDVRPIAITLNAAAREIADDRKPPRPVSEDPAVLLMVYQLSKICGIPYDVSPERIVDAMNVCTAACHSGGVTV